MTETKQPIETGEIRPARLGEILAWASYDVANSTYATVAATAVYNTHFANVIAGHIPGHDKSYGAVLLTVTICVASIIVVLTAPIVGTICDATATKKRFLFISTFICILATAGLFFVKPGDYLAGMILITVGMVGFGTGEDLIAAFLPELAHQNDMGRISALGWAAGYVGGLFSLSVCLAFMHWAQSHGMPKPEEHVPYTMLFCAAFFAVLVMPTFIFVRERAKPDPHAINQNHLKVAFHRLGTTFSHAKHYQDLFSFLLTLFVYSCGTTTVIHLASVYAQEAMGFSASDCVRMLLVVSITAAIGAGLFGTIQDKIGSIKTLGYTLGIWTLAIFVAFAAHEKWHLWVSANLVGIAMGASGSVGRALVAEFSPPGRSGEFLGLWGMAVKLATCVGALTFGGVTFFTHNLRTALLSTVLFFVVGIILLFRVNEQRGRRAALEPVE